MTQDVPFRLRVLQNLTSVLEGVKQQNGFRHDLEGSVFRGRAVYGESDPLPLVSILDAPEQPAGLDHQGSGKQLVDWTLVVQGFADDDPLNPTDPAYYLEADVKMALAREKAARGGTGEGDNDLLGMGGRVDDIRIGQGVRRPPEANVSSKAFFWLLLHLTILEDLIDPYS